jgi:hypothetical protein
VDGSEEFGGIKKTAMTTAATAITTATAFVTAIDIKGEEIATVAAVEAAATESTALFAADIAIDWVTAVILYSYYQAIVSEVSFLAVNSHNTLII